MSEHLVRRGARYYYRRRVPTDLVPFLDGKKEIQRALDTSDPKEAAIRARKMAVQIDELFAVTRTRERVQVASGGKQGLTGMHEGEHGDPDENELEQDVEAARTEAALARFKEGIDKSIRDVLAGVMYSPVVPSAPGVATHAPTTPTETAVGLAEALRHWERARDPSGSTRTTAHTLVSRFWEVCGKLPLRKIQREHIVQFQTALKADGKQASTIRTSISLLHAVLSPAVDEGWIKDNPVKGVKTTGQKRAKTARLSFTVDEINLIFGSLPTNGARYWLPIIGLYTGLRLEEIGQLAPVDIVQERYRDKEGKEHKVYVIYVTEEGAGQGLKNESSCRRVPVHRVLVDLGFIKYVHSQKGARLFPELKPDKNGRETAGFSARFGEIKRELGITDKRKTFHSFRHFFKDIMREVGVTEEVSDALSGHTTGSVSRDYGSGFFPLRPLVEAIERYEVHGVKLPTA
jgi:integrase